jgi:hypothetical protein
MVTITPIISNMTVHFSTKQEARKLTPIINMASVLSGSVLVDYNSDRPIPWIASIFAQKVTSADISRGCSRRAKLEVSSGVISDES